AAGKLPQTGEHGLRAPLRDQIAVAPGDDRRDDAQMGSLDHRDQQYCGKRPAMVKRVTPPEAAALLGQGWAYLDVRSIPEFEVGHPAGAANIPLLHYGPEGMTPNADFERVVEATFPRDAKLVVGCKVGGRSLQAAALLMAAGYGEVLDMRGGFMGERDAF